MIRPLLLTLLLATPAAAQVIPTGSPAADILLAQAIADHRVFLTCSALDPQSHQAILLDWQEDTAKAAALLAARNVAKDAILAFTAATRPENLMPAPDTPWAEVQQLCDTHPDWQASYARPGRIRLASQLPSVLP